MLNIEQIVSIPPLVDFKKRLEQKSILCMYCILALYVNFISPYPSPRQVSPQIRHVTCHVVYTCVNRISYFVCESGYCHVKPEGSLPFSKLSYR